MTTNFEKESIETDIVYQKQILQGVSRTFALTIPQLSGHLSHVVSNAYLLCRIADIIEDEPALSVTQKKVFLEKFTHVITGQVDAESFAKKLSLHLSSSTTKDQHDLIANTARIIRITKKLHPVQQRILEHCVKVMAGGMAEFQEKSSSAGLDNLSRLNRYCYYVAGVVGEMLTDLFCDYSEDIKKNRKILMTLSISYGQGLQMVNILKDIWDDRFRGACWLPRDIFMVNGFELRSLCTEVTDTGFIKGLSDLIAITHGHLENALKYILTIPPRETGIRKYCLWSLGMALLTLRRIYAKPNFKSGREVKISRYSVYGVIIITSILARLNFALKTLFKITAFGLPYQKVNASVTK